MHGAGQGPASTLEQPGCGADRTLVLGLGNPILTDDGVGVHVAEAVRTALPAGAPVDVSEASVGGLTLMESMVGRERVILIDALRGGDGAPGTVQRMGLEELGQITATLHSTCPHDTSLLAALEVGRCMGLRLPSQITIFAITIQNVDEFGAEPTPAVAAAIPAAAAAVLAELGQRQGPGAGATASAPAPTSASAPAPTPAPAATEG